VTHTSPDAAELIFEPYLFSLRRQRDRTASLTSFFGAKEPSLAPDDVLEAAARRRDRKRAREEPTSDGTAKRAKVARISDARSRKAKAAANVLPAGQPAINLALFTKREREDDHEAPAAAPPAKKPMLFSTVAKPAAPKPAAHKASASTAASALLNLFKKKPVAAPASQPGFL